MANCTAYGKPSPFWDSGQITASYCLESAAGMNWAGEGVSVRVTSIPTLASSVLRAAPMSPFASSASVSSTLSLKPPP